MGFQEAVRTCLREKYFTFSGRASRSEYWWYVLFQLLVMLVMVAVFFLFGGMQAIETGSFSTLNIIVSVLIGLVMIYIYIPYIAVYVRRFHDYNLSGWLVLAVFVLSNIPYVGFVISIAAIVVTCLKGTDGDNKYGPDPLQDQNSADVFA